MDRHEYFSRLIFHGSRRLATKWMARLHSVGSSGKPPTDLVIYRKWLEQNPPKTPQHSRSASGNGGVRLWSNRRMYNKQHQLKTYCARSNSPNFASYYGTQLDRKKTDGTTVSPRAEQNA
jgi:hypothetical protein